MRSVFGSQLLHELQHFNFLLGLLPIELSSNVTPAIDQKKIRRMMITAGLSFEKLAADSSDPMTIAGAKKPIVLVGTKRFRIVSQVSRGIVGGIGCNADDTRSLVAQSLL